MTLEQLKFIKSYLLLLIIVIPLSFVGGFIYAFLKDVL